MIQPIEYSNKVVQVHEHIHVYDSTMTLLRTAYVMRKRRIRTIRIVLQKKLKSTFARAILGLFPCQSIHFERSFISVTSIQ